MFTLPVAVDSMQQRHFGAIDDGALEADVVVMAVPCRFMSGAIRG